MATHSIQSSGKSIKIAIAGDLTSPVVPELQASLRQELARGADDVEFDLHQAVTLDSSGIGLLIACHNSLAGRRGRLRVTNVAPEIVQLLQNLRLVQRFSVSGRTNG